MKREDYVKSADRWIFEEVESNDEDFIKNNAKKILQEAINWIDGKGEKPVTDDMDVAQLVVDVLSDIGIK
jgi:hypothetical protein